MDNRTTMDTNKYGLLIDAEAGPGILHQVTGVIAEYKGDIGSVSIVENSAAGSRVYFEVITGRFEEMIAELRALPVVRRVDVVKSMEKMYGKRIIIMGGGAQVSQVAIGAIVEADRHNIRGEHISVDTIPLVGEQQLADAVRAVPRFLLGGVLGITSWMTFWSAQSQWSGGCGWRSGKGRPENSGGGLRDNLCIHCSQSCAGRGWTRHGSRHRS